MANFRDRIEMMLWLLNQYHCYLKSCRLLCGEKMLAREGKKNQLSELLWTILEMNWKLLFFSIFNEKLNLNGLENIRFHHFQTIFLFVFGRFESKVCFSIWFELSASEPMANEHPIWMSRFLFSSSLFWLRLCFTENSISFVHIKY